MVRFWEAPNKVLAASTFQIWTSIPTFMVLPENKVRLLHLKHTIVNIYKRFVYFYFKIWLFFKIKFLVKFLDATVTSSARRLVWLNCLLFRRLMTSHATTIDHLTTAGTTTHQICSRLYISPLPNFHSTKTAQFLFHSSTAHFVCLVSAHTAHLPKRIHATGHLKNSPVCKLPRKTRYPPKSKHFICYFLCVFATLQHSFALLLSMLQFFLRN